MDKILFEEQKKRFQQLSEFVNMSYGVNGGMVDEENPQDNPEQQGDTAEEDPNQAGLDMGAEQGTAPLQGADTQEMAPQDMGAQGMGQQQQTPQGFNPQEDLTQDDFNTQSDETPTKEDNVVDITALTDSQEETERDIAELGNKFSTLIQKLDKFAEVLDSNDKKIDDLRADFEKRNPTQIEKMSMNTAKGEPFTVSPKEYWDEKEASTNYRTEPDENGVKQGQYVITQNDVNGDTDWAGIAKTLGDDFIFHPTVEKAFGLVR